MKIPLRPDRRLLALALALPAHAADPAPANDQAKTKEPAKMNKDELRAKLTPQQYKVACEGGTEPPFHNAYWDNHEPGIYVDVIRRGSYLRSSLRRTSSDSGTGWPSFTRTLKQDAIVEKKDASFGMVRTEVRSSKSDAHLGHVFEDGPNPTTSAIASIPPRSASFQWQNSRNPATVNTSPSSRRRAKNPPRNSEHHRRLRKTAQELDARRGRRLPGVDCGGRRDHAELAGDVFRFLLRSCLPVALHFPRRLGFGIAVFSGLVALAANFDSIPVRGVAGYLWSGVNRMGGLLIAAGYGISMRNYREEVRRRLKAAEHAHELEREIVRAGEREQMRIGQDLHDGVCQTPAAYFRLRGPMPQNGPGCAGFGRRRDSPRKSKSVGCPQPLSKARSLGVAKRHLPTATAGRRVEHGVARIGD